jgi:hypothetical protein
LALLVESGSQVLKQHGGDRAPWSDCAAVGFCPGSQFTKINRVEGLEKR